MQAWTAILKSCEKLNFSYDNFSANSLFSILVLLAGLEDVQEEMLQLVGGTSTLYILIFQLGNYDILNHSASTCMCFSNSLCLLWVNNES